MTIRTCPRCNQKYLRYPALSRRDNFTEICPECGQIEAFEDMGWRESYEGPCYWHIFAKRGKK